ncbi:gliding motility-associated ABC transporter ATP-binding subunit GldA [Reichenbachiella carrageenanivorans]|uniref:Gliding motility-associated ABC transporter ATP-binding subunit GldA n=1 Tax=Reichenbachiella carrageenanivorans TaxID=2979869 RepID=A0ABY6CWK9_9BACT|nr:gliding motility-associated ABC transporter ATP-binding subunit GldA [Reichenbachiella carrageenanivorans]UXX78306.1 gliding motility-associated ABC transporter ATP-binding subunit GldA [Reichenbachiella carrageenanivorans]
MSIEVQNLTKTYGQQKAVDGISFSANRGEILGFLGPNGAGKSTTMKIATGYLGATAGQVLIGGINVAEDPISAKRITGYLPEHNPLYLDMYIHEFLAFSAKVNQMKVAEIKAAVKRVVEMCGLTLEQNKKIGQLSKGYRQRVGLAQALLHDPEVLILDEPTTGLDPNQILEIRKLIKEVSKDKTVIFSSHIMQEVEALCDRVVVINKGQLVADQPITEFSKGLSDETWLRVEFKSAIDQKLLTKIIEVTDVQAVSPCIYKLQVTNSEEARSAVFKLAGEKNLPLVGLQEEESSFDEIFHLLTKEK